jgi:hypothetical protein
LIISHTIIYFNTPEVNSLSFSNTSIIFIIIYIRQDRWFHSGEVDLGFGVTVNLGFLALSSTLFSITGFLLHVWWSAEQRSIGNLFILKPIDIISQISDYFLGLIFYSQDWHYSQADLSRKKDG